MTYSSYHKKAIRNRELHPETQMMSYGYDPFLSEGAVKPPVFLRSPEIKLANRPLRRRIGGGRTCSCFPPCDSSDHVRFGAREV